MKQLIKQWLLSCLLLASTCMVFGQSRVEFKYGDKEEFTGGLTAHLVMVAKEKQSNQAFSKILRSADDIIDTDKYKDIVIIMRLTDFDLAKEEHAELSWLEIPLIDTEYYPSNIPGLRKISQTQVLVMGSKAIQGARRFGDVRFALTNEAKNGLKGNIQVKFDFVSALFEDIKISFPDSLSYTIAGSGGSNVGSTFEAPVEEFSEEDPEPVVESSKANQIEEETYEPEPEPSYEEEETVVIEEEITPEPEPEPAPVEEESIDMDASAADLERKGAPTKEAEAVSVEAKVPSFINSAPEKGEDELFRRIKSTEKVRKLNTICERYRDKFPSGFYTEEVLYTQINNAPTSNDKEKYLEEYLELFPEGKYIERVNTIILEDFDGFGADGGGTALEVASFPAGAITAEVDIQDGVLFIDHIKGGTPPFQIEFYDIEEAKMKNYSLDIGKNRAFRVNLKALPLEGESYVVGIIDAQGTAPFYSTPVSLTGTSKRWSNFSFISTILGGLILVALVLLYLTNKMSFSGQRRIRSLVSRRRR